MAHQRPIIRFERPNPVSRLELRDESQLILMPFPVREWLFYWHITAASRSCHAHSHSPAVSLTHSVLSDVCPITSVGKNHGLLARTSSLLLSDLSSRLHTEQVFSWLGLKPRKGEKNPTEVIGSTYHTCTPRNSLRCNGIGSDVPF